MISPGVTRPLSLALAILLATPFGFSQAPVPAAAPPSATLPSAAPASAGTLKIVVLEGNNAVNSISRLRSVAPVVEIRDQNDFPVEGATVVFTLPAQGTGGSFAGSGTSFSTRSDSHGQATSPPIVPRSAGKFEIAVAASTADRKGEAVIPQTNSTGAYTGPPLPGRPWYKKRVTWYVAGGVVAAAVIVIVLTRGSKASSTPVVITPGSPVFQ